MEVLVANRGADGGNCLDSRRTLRALTGHSYRLFISGS